MKSCLVLCLALLLSGCTAPSPGVQASATPSHPRAGGPTAPAFHLLSPTGEKVEFAPGARYEVTVVSFWSPSWDPDHESLLSQLQALHQRFKEHPLRVVAICYEEKPENIQRYLQQHPMDLEVAMGDKPTYESFQLEDIPTTLLISPEGSIIERLTGHSSADSMADKISPFFPQ